MRFAIGRRYAALGIGAPLLFAVVVALLAFAWLSGPGTTSASTDGAAMSLRVDASQTIACPGGPVAGKVCISAGQQFDVIVVADGIPLTNGYMLVQAWVDYDSNGLVHKPAVDPGTQRDHDVQCATGANNPCNLWPDLQPLTFLTFHDLGNNGMLAGGLTALGPPHPPSFHKGDLFSFSLTCTPTQSSHTLNILPSGDPVAGTGGAIFVEPLPSGISVIPSVTGITVNCVVPPTPNPVGGIAVDPELRALPLETANSDNLPWGIWFAFMAAASILAVAGATLRAWTGRSRSYGR